MKKNDDWRWKRSIKEWRKTQSRYKWVLGPRTAQLIEEKEQKNGRQMARTRNRIA